LATVAGLVTGAVLVGGVVIVVGAAETYPVLSATETHIAIKAVRIFIFRGVQQLITLSIAPRLFFIPIQLVFYLTFLLAELLLKGRAWLVQCQIICRLF